jgi:hypothetical protein
MALLTHLLVDFDNVKPSATDIALLQGADLRLAVVRGAQPTRYEADLAEALHELADRVTFTRCAKSGKNAADMQIAFHLGELVSALPGAGAARFVVISKDKDFDALLAWLQAKGVDATRAPSFKAALGRGEPVRPPRAAKARAAKAVPVASPPSAPAAKKPARKSAKSPARAQPKAVLTTPRPTPAKAALITPPAAAPKKAAHAAARTPARAPDLAARAIEALHTKGAERPGKRKGLERFLESHLGRKFAPGQLDALIAALEADGVLRFDGNKVDYRLPKAKK